MSFDKIRLVIDTRVGHTGELASAERSISTMRRMRRHVNGHI